MGNDEWNDECSRYELSPYLADRGWELVEPYCPECSFGQIVRHPKYGSSCTAYGQCELAPG